MTYNLEWREYQITGVGAMGVLIGCVSSDGGGTAEGMELAVVSTSF
jgi:hypothetical protein